MQRCQTKSPAGSLASMRFPHALASSAVLLCLVSAAAVAGAGAEHSIPPSRDTSDGGTAAVSLPSPYKALNIEEIYYRQDALVSAELAGLRPQRPGRADLYFVGFAGYSYENVFFEEARSARGLFDRAYDTTGRSILLVNNLATLKASPLATTHNLQTALRGLGRIMDRDEDIAVVFLTSHGAPDRLSVEFGPLGLNDLSPGALRAMLDDAGIGWRVIIVSACYSGAFIDALKTERTLVITAARADRASFGCAAGNEFTYFGQAFFAEALHRGGSLIDGFRRAAAAIAAREQREGLVASQPQIHVGAAIAVKLAAIQGPPEAAAAR